MELNDIFVNIGDEIKNYHGGGGYSIPDCNELDSIHAKVLDINYIKREILIGIPCNIYDSRGRLSEEKINRFTIKHSDQTEWKKWTSDYINPISQIKNAIIELLNMRLINNESRCAELKTKINQLISSYKN
jgi:hypothetical protein